MVLLQVADHRLNTRPQSLHPPKLGLLFMGHVHFSLAWDRYLPDH